MKKMAPASFLVLLLIICVSPRIGSAQTPGSSASGSYRFLLEDEYMKFIEFDAMTDAEGVSKGMMSFTDEAGVMEQDVDGTGDQPPGDQVPFSMRAEFDTLIVEKNRALMSGVIIDSNLGQYLRRWVQLVVEDNGDNREIPDKIVWRICQQPPGYWIPTDAEVPGDRGAWLSWWATDAERKYDVGIPSKSYISGEMKGCEVYTTLQPYEFAFVSRGEGYIVVRQ